MLDKYGVVKYNKIKFIPLVFSAFKQEQSNLCDKCQSIDVRESKAQRTKNVPREEKKIEAFSYITVYANERVEGTLWFNF